VGDEAQRVGVTQRPDHQPIFIDDRELSDAAQPHHREGIGQAFRLADAWRGHGMIGRGGERSKTNFQFGRPFSSHGPFFMRP